MKCKHELKLRIFGAIIKIPEDFEDPTQKNINHYVDEEHERLAPHPSSYGHVFMACKKCPFARRATMKEKDKTKFGKQ